MANKKFSEFTVKTDPANVDFLVGYDGADNVRIDPANLGGGGASDLNGLSDCLVDTDSLYVGEVPSGLSGNPQGNTTVGIDAGNALTTGTNNTFIGNDAGLNVTTSASNTVLGSNALGYHNGNNNVAIGTNAMQGSASFTGTGTDNVAIGYNAGSGSSPTAFSNSILIGKDAATSPNGISNAIVLGNSSHTTLQIPGIQSGASNGDVLTFNSSLGKLELQAAGGGGASDLNGLSDVEIDTTDNSSYFINIPSGISGQFAERNLVIGIGAGNAMTSADSTVAIGFNALNNLTTGFGNTAVGREALATEDTSSRNTAFGYHALINANSSSSNGYNTSFGYSAGKMVFSGSQNTCIGGNAGWFSYPSTMSNSTMLGYNALPSTNNASNEITLGNSSVATLRCAVTSITSLSDERDKTDIKDLEYGLAFIDALQPREFVWDNRPEILMDEDEDGNTIETEFYSANKGKKDFGFIAQEVRELDNDTLRLVYTENEEKLELSYGKLVPILVKAIQELKEEVELLKG